MAVVAVIAYARAGARASLLLARRAQSNLPCRTKPGQFDPLYPHHLRGLRRVRRSGKKNNFLPTTGFHLV